MRVIAGERLLWLAVLGEQMVLACRERDPMGLHGRPAVDAARRWIGSEDFRVVCDLAGVEPEWVARRVAGEMAKPRSERHLERIGLRHVSSGMSLVRDVSPVLGAAA